MKIAHIIYAFPTGGTETMLVDILNEQVKYEQISLIILNDCIDRKLISKISNKVSICLINRKSRSRNPIPFLRFNYFLARNTPDIIHCHNYSLVNLISPLIKSKIVLTIHDVKINSKYHVRYDKLYAISEAVQKDIKIRVNLDSKVIYNGVKISDILFRIKIESKVFKIIQVSRLDHLKKGQEILIKAMDVLINKYHLKNIELDFIGEGQSLQYLNELVNRYNLNQNITFLGLRDRNYIYSRLKNYNLLVQPSFFEGFGLTIIEAMAAGINVLVSEIDGPLEIINKMNSGFKFESGSVDECASKIYDIISQENKLISTEKFEIQRNTCKNLFDVEITAKKYLDEYKKLLSV